MRKIFSIFFIFLLGSTHLSVAQPLRIWSELTYNHLLDDQKTDILLQTHVRGIPDKNTINQVIQRNMLGYWWTPKWGVYGGYDFVVNTLIGQNRSIHEHRILQQLSYRNEWSKTNLEIRSRLEERILDNHTGPQVRLRERAYVTLGSIFNDHRPVIYDEIFLNFNHQNWGSPRFVDQNRAFLGLLFRLKKQLVLETGLMHQWVSNQQSGQGQKIISVALRYNP